MKGEVIQLACMSLETFEGAIASNNVKSISKEDHYEEISYIPYYN